MRKIISCVFILSFLGGIACAAGPASRCVLTIKKVELKNISGDWKIAFEGAAPIDLAAPDPVATLKSQAGLPEGSYIGVRLTIGETLEVSGRDGQFKTRQAGELELRGTAKNLDELPGQIESFMEKSPTYSSEGEGVMRVTLDFDYADRDHTIEISSSREFDKPFSGKPNSEFRLSLRADLKESIVHLWPKYYDKFPEKDAMIFNFPKNFTEFSITTEDATAYSGGKVVVLF